jgi:dCMP deaminase
MTMMATRKDKQMMELCKASAEIFRTCSRRAVSAVIVDKRHHIVGMGYNGVPSKMQHCILGGCPRASMDVKPGTEYSNCLAVHAEANALLHSDYTSDAEYLYVNCAPCFECAKLIANSTIGCVYYLNDPNFDSAEAIALLHAAGVETYIMGEINASE